MFARVDRRTRTPLFSTAFTTLAVLLLALMLPLHQLADLTSHLTLVVFAFVNLSLIRIKARGGEAPEGVYVAPSWVPWAGFSSCLALTLSDLGLLLLG